MLTIKNLKKTYSNGVKALNDISLDIPKGMFGLLGPNGAGKSSLMRTLATLQEPDDGSAQLDDIDIINNKDTLRKVLGYLPQEFGVYPRVSPELMLDHLATLKGVTRKGERRETVDALLHQTNLYDVRKKSIDTFSGGMKQRFGIAQALIGEPKLIIVDEPTAGLDPSERNRFHNLLAEIGENVVVILSTHIVDDVSDLCANMAIMGEGEILLTGTPSDVLDKLKNKLWRTKIKRGDIATYRDQHQVILSHLSAGQTIIHVLSDDSPGQEFEPIDADLEDVYFSTLLSNGINVSF
ncbi:MAG: ABC transporter ATP-binding protein [Planctomycetaceae bacterium]|jgi:ABC-type multidrug transport system ATPase subunit|nr:ABC transporter ATP-binding protein [Gammaproteobacteria bacterium]MBT4158796.1 ABC transporter ATP-binding protein [Planctomycetaceae bacterium]MBT5726118.1 ABC transporter ATP-binding protein [Gammaproteobacteria bacterium]|tara:strand:+ start:207 stop:1091 length:885 start_codon:yes stop_codon:yes gene_type:complete